MSNKKYMYTAMVLVTLALVTAVPVFADNNTSANQSGGGNQSGMRGGRGNSDNSGNKGQMMKFGVSGIVSAISGNTLTVTSNKKGDDSNSNPIVTVFTVDATNAKVVKNNVAGNISSIVVGDIIMAQGTLTGTNLVATNILDGQITMMNRGKQGIVGIVSAVSGNTLTVTSNKKGGDSNSNPIVTTFTVDATNAKVMKNGVAGIVASILVGDTVMVQGTLTGTNVVATAISDGQNNSGDKSGKLPPVVGNGQPIVVGTVSSISGSTITITNKSNVTYTVDATNAKIVQGQNAIVVSNIAVGDMVVVQGTINGNAVVATSVIDQAKPASSNTTAGENEKGNGGFFGGIGSFFAHLFGF